MNHPPPTRSAACDLDGASAVLVTDQGEGEGCAADPIDGRGAGVLFATPPTKKIIAPAAIVIGRLAICIITRYWFFWGGGVYESAVKENILS